MRLTLENRRRRRLTIFLNFVARRGSHINRQYAVQVLNDEMLFNEVFDRLNQERTLDEERRPLLDLLDYLIENADAIFAIIETIIKLFAGLSAQVVLIDGEFTPQSQSFSDEEKCCGKETCETPCGGEE